VNRRNLTRCGIVLAAWLVATGSGPCAFFKPTEPEIGKRVDPIIPDYSTPDKTLETLARGMVDKGRSNGQDVYMAGLADSTLDGRAFYAFFDPRDLIEHPWAYGDWTRDFEPQLLYDLYHKHTNPFEMTWEQYQPGGNDELHPDFVIIPRKYTLVQLVTNGNTVTRSPIAIGAARLTLLRSNRNSADWVIAIWQDIRTADADSAQITSMGRRRLETR
jgi:hypothetical protein